MYDTKGPGYRNVPTIGSGARLLVVFLGALCMGGRAGAQQPQGTLCVPGGGPSPTPASVTGIQRSLGGPNVVPPPLWYSGDTHEHIQLCPTIGMLPDGSIGSVPMDKTSMDIYLENLPANLNVSAIAYWRPRQNTLSDFYNDYILRLTGDEDPVTQNDPNFVIQYGVETSGFTCSIRGHTLGIGIYDGNIDSETLYPAPNLQFFHSQAGAITGYAHQMWPTGLTMAGGFVGTDYQCMSPTGMDFPNVVQLWGAAAPVYAPFDAVFHNIDFLETIDMAILVPPDYRWTGMWYKLLSAGVPVECVAGTDANCYTPASGLDPRTWVKIPNDPITFDKWTKGIATGNYSLALGPSQFLEMTVNSQPAGSKLYVLSANNPSVTVTATYTVAAGVTKSDTIEIVEDGQVVDSMPFTNLSGGSVTFTTTVPITESTWIAARTASYETHTGVVSVFDDEKPITDCASDEYFVLYAEYLQAFLDLADSYGMLSDYVGTQEDEIRTFIDDGADIFRLHRAYELAMPAGFRRVGMATASCEGPSAIIAQQDATAGATIPIECLDGPRLASGWLVVGSNNVPAGYNQNGAKLYVANDSTTSLIPVVVDDRGYAEIDVTVPDTPGEIFYAQWAWNVTPNCTSTNWVASDAFEITAQ